jgi:hypothetical protein
VAKISDEGLLGMDVLQNGLNGPADILLSQGVMEWQGHRITGSQVGRPRVLKVRAKRDYHIPSQSEAVIQAEVDAGGTGENLKGDYITEPSENFVDRHRVMVPRGVLSIGSPESQDLTVKILNPFPIATKINR